MGLKGPRGKDPIEEQLEPKPREVKTPIKAKDFLSTGSTVLNLACSGKTSGGIPKGVPVLIVGDSSSGKSVFAMTILAEAARNPEFDGYYLVYDPTENGVLMDVQAYYGSKLAGRLRYPGGGRDPAWSPNLDGFYDNLEAVMKRKPCVYVLDSMDAVESKDDSDPGKGYGTAKAKTNSSRLRVVSNRIRDTGSILLIVSQTRQNIGFGAQFNPKTRAGGTSLKFYSRLEWWLSVVGKIKAKVGDKSISIGIRSQIKVAKNHVTGWEGNVQVPLYRRFGVDDVGGCVDFLVEFGYWEKNDRGVISALELGLGKTYEKLCLDVGNDEGLMKELRTVVAAAWADLEQRTSVRRMQRYE